MDRDRVPSTSAAGVAFTPHFYDCEEHGGSRGFPAGIAARVVTRLLAPPPVEVAQDG